jgi:hypothetical protein
MRHFLLMLAWLQAALAQTDIGVLGLFRSSVFELTPLPGEALEIETAAGTEVLESGARRKVRYPARLVAHGRNGAAAGFLLSIPGRIERRYLGTLRIEPGQGVLIARIVMDLEIAVASVIAAEAGHSQLEALRALAVAARSYLTASGKRHRDFTFCDTTHCQFLREPPAASSPAWYAAQSTAGIVLAYHGKPVQALYSASCGGQTRSLREAGWRVDDYEFPAVKCGACRGLPARGHRVGLCQTGAQRRALAGSDFRAILGHYFPGTALLDLRASSASMP